MAAERGYSRPRGFLLNPRLGQYESQRIAKRLEYAYEEGGNHTHREIASIRIKSNMNLMNKIDRVAKSHQRASCVNIILPTVYLVVIL